MDLFQKPYRYRYALIIIKLAVILHIFMSSKDVCVVIWHTFRATVSGKTVCEWSKKFPEILPQKKKQRKKEGKVILFVDEKFIWIKSVQAYWWTVRDDIGNILAVFVSMSRDSDSAKELFRRAKSAIDCRVDAVVHDGLTSYNRAVGWAFGRRCKNIITGINGKFVMIGKYLYWLTNNMSESINAQIDAYLAKHHYNFNNLQSANRYAEMFMLRKSLRDACC